MKRTLTPGSPSTPLKRAKHAQMESPLDPALKCPICFSVPLTAVSHECGHVFCLTCWNRWTMDDEGNGLCPTCRQGSKAVPDYRARQMLKRVQFPCRDCDFLRSDNNKHVCRWTCRCGAILETAEFREHLSDQKHSFLRSWLRRQPWPLEVLAEFAYACFLACPPLTSTTPKKDWLVRATSSGSVVAAFAQAEIFDQAKNPACVGWYKHAAAHGSVPAALELGLIFLMEHYSQYNLQREGRRWLKVAANGGCVQAQVHLGLLYQDMGLAEPLAGQKAVYWLELAARQNNAEALVALADCYRTGFGVEVNYEEEGVLLRRACDQDSPVALCRMGHWMQKHRDYKEAEVLCFFRKAAKMGSADAYWFWGQAESDPEVALSCLRKAADAGHVQATFEFATRLQSLGQFEEAAQLFKTVAKVTCKEYQ